MGQTNFATPAAAEAARAITLELRELHHAVINFHHRRVSAFFLRRAERCNKHEAPGAQDAPSPSAPRIARLAR